MGGTEVGDPQCFSEALEAMTQGDQHPRASLLAVQLGFDHRLKKAVSEMPFSLIGPVVPPGVMVRHRRSAGVCRCAR